MIVTCERCATQFQLDDARVPTRGVRVRCSRCKNSFRVVPEGLAAAEQIADLARRAREDGEEITQDIPETREASGPQRAERPSARRADAHSADAAPGSGVEAKGGPGVESEESDWEFNNDLAGDLERGAHPDPNESKPDPPEAAPARGRLADDWFGGGAGDAPLELEARPRTQAAAAPPPLQRRPPPAATPRAPLPPPPAPAAVREPAPPLVREPAPAPVREPAPALARESVLAPDPDLELASEPDSTPRREPAPAPKVRVERRAPRDPADELSAHSWGDLLAAAEDSEVPAPRSTGEALRAKATSRLAAWLGRFGHTLGSGLTLALFGAGLYAGLTPSERLAPGLERVAGLELDSVEARFVENAAAGTLFVVSGRVRNPGPGDAALGRLALELLDAEGRPLGGAGLHPPAPLALLREAPLDALSQLPRLSGEVRSGEVRSFEAVVASLPAEAREFRIVESHATPPSATEHPARPRPEPAL